MESDEVLRYFLDEAKDTQNDINSLEELHLPDEAEEATEFLHYAGLSDLSNIYRQGQEITEKVVSDSVRQRNLTEKQAQTVLSRVRTLNKTLRSRQPRRKHRQDVRDVTWKVDASSNGSRSRSATPDSLDSGDILKDRLTPEEEQQLNSLPSIPLNDNRTELSKTKIKFTISEPLHGKKIYRNDRGDVADSGSENVVLKGYQPLTENGSLPRPHQRERSGSDPTTDVLLQQMKSSNLPVSLGVKSDKPLSHSHNNIVTQDNCSKVYLNSDKNYNEDIQAVSFESILKENTSNKLKSVITYAWDPNDGIAIDDLSDSEYQYLKPVLYLELVAIFDQYNITRGYYKRKASKNKRCNVFGVNLSTLVMRDMPRPTDNSMVPEVFQSLLQQLNERCVGEDGILRVACQKHKLETLCTEIESKFFSNRSEVEKLLQGATAHELCSVLKKLLRDLPEPIFTMELFESFYKTSVISNEDDQLKALNLLVLMLPVEHRNTFRLLLTFFRNIVLHEKQNRMNLQNVAMIMAPSFFPPRLVVPKDNTDKMVIKNITKEDMVERINSAAVCCNIMKTMLVAGDKLWVVPNYLVGQAREAQAKAQMRRDLSKDKRIRSGKVKLARSSTQYEPGAIVTPRIKQDLLI